MSGSAEIIVEVEAERTSIDLVSFEDDVEGSVGWRPDVVPSGAPNARPGRPVGASVTSVA